MTSQAGFKYEFAMTEKDEAVLCFKELKRQLREMRDKLGSDAVDDAMASSPLIRDLQNNIEALRDCRVTEDEAELENKRVGDLLAEAIREEGDPALVTSVDAEIEAKAKHLSEAAQALLSDAVKSAGAGLSKERWIGDVLNGHIGDDEAQLGCLRHIVALWNDGPWAWPRVESKG